MSSSSSSMMNLKDSATKKLTAEEETELQKKIDEKRDIEFRKALQGTVSVDPSLIKSRNKLLKVSDQQIIEALNELGLKVLTKNTLSEFIKDVQLMSTMLDDSLVCSIDDVKRVFFDSKETQNVREKLRAKYQKEYNSIEKEYKEQQSAAVANEHYAQLLKKQQLQNAKLLQQQQLENVQISRIESPTTVAQVENTTTIPTTVQPKRTTAMSLAVKKPKEEFNFEEDDDYPTTTKKQDELPKKNQNNSNSHSIIADVRTSSGSLPSQQNLPFVEQKKNLVQKSRSTVTAAATGTTVTVSTPNRTSRTPVVVGDDFSIDKYLETNNLEIFPIDPDLIKKEPVLIRLLMGIMLEITNSIIKNYLKRSMSFKIENTIADGKMWKKCEELINRNPKYHAYIKTTKAYEGEQVALLIVEWENGGANKNSDSGTESD